MKKKQPNEEPEDDEPKCDCPKCNPGKGFTEIHIVGESNLPQEVLESIAHLAEKIKADKAEKAREEEERAKDPRVQKVTAMRKKFKESGDMDALDRLDRGISAMGVIIDALIEAACIRPSAYINAIKAMEMLGFADEIERIHWCKQAFWGLRQKVGRSQDWEAEMDDTWGGPLQGPLNPRS